MKVVSAAEMRSIDERTIRECGISGAALMERAGAAVAVRVREGFDKKKVIVLAGGGNNGGDGLVAARTLHGWGWNVRVLIMQKKDRLSPDCLAQYRTAKKLGVPIAFTGRIDQRDLHGAIVIDALLGTGLNKPVKPPMSDAIRFVNDSGVPVLSVDIPSGISADTGQVLGEAVRADFTVTFGLPKIGHYLHPGAGHCGKLIVEDIGFPEALLDSEDIRVRLADRAAASALLPERPLSSHKGDYGHVLVVAGSTGKTGAALMTARACLRSGAGMVTIGVPETLVPFVMSRVTEEMVLPLDDAGNGVLSGKASDRIADFLSETADVLAIGPGLTAGEPIREIMKAVVGSVTVPMVIDADAVNASASITGLLANAKAPVILTPHPGEMARLMKGARRSGVSSHVSSIEQDRLGSARSFAREFLVTLVLKGVPTVIAEPEGTAFINTTGNPGMATAGSGDVLTGMIAGLLGQGLAAPSAAALGVFLHGRAGDLAAAQKGMHSLIATDILESIPSAFLDLLHV